jgi:homospermidine synthase
MDRIRHWVSAHGAGASYVSSFVKKLLADLQVEVSEQLEEADKAESRSRRSIRLLGALSNAVAVHSAIR